MDKILAKIEQIRQQKGITKTHIWKHCGKSAAWYSEVSRGKSRLYVEDLLKIAEALDVEPANFFIRKLSVTLSKENKRRSA